HRPRQGAAPDRRRRDQDRDDEGRLQARGIVRDAREQGRRPQEPELGEALHARSELLQVHELGSGRREEQGALSPPAGRSRGGRGSQGQVLAYLTAPRALTPTAPWPEEGHAFSALTT